MAYVGRFRWARGAGGINVKGMVFNIRRPAFISAQRFARFLLDIYINAATQLVSVAWFFTMNPNSWLCGDVRSCQREPLSEFRSHDEMFRRNGIDAMGERWANQIRVEQRNHTANAGDTKPYDDVFGPIGHQ